MKSKITNLLTEIERTEKQCLEKYNALPNWEPPSLTILADFHAKYDSWKSTHPTEYYKEKENAQRQQISILQTQLRIAQEILNDKHVPEFTN
jgi:hypothetical protein